MKSYLSIAAAIATVILILVVYTKCDDIKAWNYNRHIVKADSAVHKADEIKEAGVVVRTSHNKLINSPEVTNDTTAMKVVVSSNKVIANTDSENVALRTANKELHAAGEKPVLRLIPYMDALVRFRLDSTTVKQGYMGRAGIDYRIINHISAKVEYQYDGRHQVNAGLHITFK